MDRFFYSWVTHTHTMPCAERDCSSDRVGHVIELKKIVTAKQTTTKIKVNNLYEGRRKKKMVEKFVNTRKSVSFFESEK